MREGGRGGTRSKREREREIKNKRKFELVGKREGEGFFGR